MNADGLQVVEQALRGSPGPPRLPGEWLREWFGAATVASVLGDLPAFAFRQGEIRRDGARLVVEGKADLNTLALEDAAVSVALEHGDTAAVPRVRARLSVACPPGWTFIHSFPDLWEMESTLISVIGAGALTDARFTLSSGDDGTLSKGLNFEARWRPSGLPALLAGATPGVTAVDVRGPVVLARAAQAPSHETADFPWDLANRVRGVYLSADLGAVPLSAAGLPDARLGVKIYVPCASRGDDGDLAYPPMRAYTGTLDVHGGALTFTAMHVPSLLDELVLKGKFQVDHGADHASALNRLLDGEATRFLPEAIRSVVRDFELAELGFHIVARDGGGYRIGSTHLGIAFSHTPPHWSPIPGFECPVFFKRLDLIAAHPDGPGSPQFFGAARAGATLFGSEFDVTVRVPDLVVSLEQIGGPISTDSLFKACLPTNAPRPPEFEIDRLSVTIEPGTSYAMSVTIKPGASWSAVDGKPAFPDVRLSVGSTGWEFSAGTGIEGHGVPVVDLVAALARRVGMPPVQIPAVLHTLTVDALTIAHRSASGDFFMELQGGLALDTGDAPTTLRTKLALSVSRPADAAKATTQFSGQIVVTSGSQAPLEFDLAVGAGGEASTLVAGFHDDAGLHVHVGELLAGLRAGEAARTGGASDIELILHDALFAFEKRANAPARMLLALDVEGGIELSAPRLPTLPLISRWTAAGEPLKLAVQLTFASAPFNAADVSALKKLDAAAGFLPATGIGDGVGINAALRIGTRVEQLNVPARPQQLAPSTAAVAPADAGTSSVPSDGTHWIDVHRSFGPVRCDRVGVNYHDGKLSALVDAAIAAAGLTISLDGLSVETPLSPWQPTFGLRGLGIDYRNDAVEIGGAFLQREVKDGEGRLLYRGFGGIATVRARALMLSASGMYAEVNDHPSLFLYAVLDHTFGGPPFFVVTGLAAGFGYNRALVLPSLEELPTFPLITQATGAGAAGGDVARDPATALGALERYVPPAVGETFLAVGVRFTSFKIVDSFALLVGRFSQRFEIDLLGLSTLVSPPATGGSATKTPIVQAQLALKATFIPEDGILTVQGLITSGSYVVSRECTLSGGFAFFSWFKDQPDQPGVDAAKAGDFVATLGGYHPAFKPPPYYPTVPRLQLLWQVNDRLSIKGSAYFALTAHAVMAGGLLEAVWTDGDVSASFTAAADFLLAWQPYHYDASVSVRMRADITLHVFGTHHLSFEAGAGVHLWGPEFSGTAEIHLSVVGFDVSFNVEFGDHAALPCAVDWSAFRKAFVPPAFVGAAVQAGLIRSIEPAGAPSRWIVDPAGCRLAVTSLVPVTEGLHIAPALDARLGVSPMGVVSGHFKSRLEVTVVDEAGHDVSTRLFDFEPIGKAMPAAMWATPSVHEEYGQRYVSPPDLNGRSLLDDVLVGLTVRPKLADHGAAPAGPATPADGAQPREVDGAFRWIALKSASDLREAYHQTARMPAAAGAAMRELVGRYVHA